MGNESSQEANANDSYYNTKIKIASPSDSSSFLWSETLSMSYSPTSLEQKEEKQQKVDTNTDKLCVSISPRIIKIAANFWYNNIDNINIDEKLEIGCAVFFGMVATNSKMKEFMRINRSKSTIEMMSVKYLDMIGWLIRYLVSAINNNNNSTTYTLLQSLGDMHHKMGVNIEYFDCMLRSLHETFIYYFPKNYNIQVKYSIDAIFTISAQIMNQKELNKPLNNMDFLESLEKCLKSSIGREYFFSYLQSHFCDEIVIYLQMVNKFHIQTSDKERFMIARDIVKLCIICNATFSINISYESRISTLNKMKKLEEKFQDKQAFHVNSDLFESVEMEMRRLIIKNYWMKFVDNVKKL